MDPLSLTVGLGIGLLAGFIMGMLAGLQITVIHPPPDEGDDDDPEREAVPLPFRQAS